MLCFQIYLTWGHHRNSRAQEPENIVVVQTGASEEKKSISNLRPYSHYDLAISAFNSKGEGPLSEKLSFMTPEGGEIENEKTITDANDDSWYVGGGVDVSLWQSKQHLAEGQLSTSTSRGWKSSARTDIFWAGDCWQICVTLQQSVIIVFIILWIGSSTPRVSFCVCDAASSWPSYVHANDKSIRVRDYPPLDATKQTQWNPLGILAAVPKE